jgi:competence protein ComEC
MTRKLKRGIERAKTAAGKTVRKAGKLAAASAVVLMLGFIAMTGASASIVRAVVVSSLSLAAWYVGRRPRPLVIILLAAAITAGWNPIYLWSDIGWYLSFLAFFGILILAPQIFKRFWKDKYQPISDHK